MFKHTLI